MSPRQIYRHLAVALSLVAGAAHGDESQPTVTVTGSAAVRVVPDQVTLRIGIEPRAKQPSDAADENSATVAKVVEFLRSEDVPERSVRTESLRITPIIYKRTAYGSAQKQIDDPFEHYPSPADDAEGDGASTASGYIVKWQLSITTSQVDRFEQIYRGLIEHSVNQVESIAFSTTELRKHRERARIDAARAAKKKAEALAGELGAQLAGVQSIEEIGSDGNNRSQNLFIDDPSSMPADGDIGVNTTIGWFTS